MTEIPTLVQQRIINLEQSFLDRCLPHYFGYHLLHYGAKNSPYDLTGSKIKHHILLTEKNLPTVGVNRLQSRYDAIPIANNSVDVVFLPHILENVAKPRAVIDEACRIVIPYGHIIIFGYNRWSLLGAMTSGQQTQQWLTAARIRRWLAYQSFEMISQDFGFYSPAWSSASLLERSLWLEKVGHVGWRQLGGVYCLVARKCIATVTLLKPTWQKSRAIRASCGVF